MRFSFHRILAGLAISLALVLVLFTETRSATLADSQTKLVVATLTSPTGANSSEPQFTITGNRVILSWLETAGKRATLKFSERTVTGWSAPKTAVAGTGFYVNSEDVPSVRALADGTLMAQWLRKNAGDPDPDSDAYDVLLSWSWDQGGTWSTPASPHHDGTDSEHGFVSTFDAPDGNLGLVWLDGRGINPETEKGNMSLHASIYDRTGKQLREMTVAPRVCECCSTSAAQTSEGPIVAFRNRSADEIRDIYVSRFADGHWSAPAAVHDDGWRINACPVNGPAISARGKNVAVAWFTAVNNQGRAFVAFSRDAGRTFGHPIRVDQISTRGRVGVQLLDDDSAAVTWVEVANNQTQFRTRTVTSDGLLSAPVVVSANVAAGFPRLARNAGELLFSWMEKDHDVSQIHTARSRIGAPVRRYPLSE